MRTNALNADRDFRRFKINVGWYTDNSLNIIDVMIGTLKIFHTHKETNLKQSSSIQAQ